MQSLIRRYRRSFEGLPRSTWILSAVMLVNRSGAMVMAFLSIYFSHELGWGERFAGNAIAVYGVGAVFGAYLGGRLSRQFGAFRVQQVSLVGSAVGYIVLSQMFSKPSVLTTLFLVSVASEALRPANAISIVESVPPGLQRRAFALNRLAVNLGFTFGPAIGGLLAQHSYTLLFIGDAVTCLAAAALLTGMHHAERRRSQSGAASSSAAENAGEHAAVASSRQFACFVGVSFVVFVVFFQLLSTYPIFLRSQYAMAEWQIGMLFSINTLIIVATEMVLIESLRRYQDLRIIAAGTFLICEGFAILSFGERYPFAIAALLVWTLGEMTAMPTMFAYVGRTAPVGAQSKRIGIYSTTVALAFVIAPLLGAWCYSIHPRLIWWVAAAAGPCVWVAYLRIAAAAEMPVRRSTPRVEEMDRSIGQQRERCIRDTGLERVEPSV